MSLNSRQLLALLVATLLFTPGCSLFKGSLNPDNLNKVGGDSTLAILYRTESDRLNLASGGAGGVQQASYQQNGGSLLPPVSMSTLKVVYPHPAGRPDHAQVFVAFSATNEESANDSSSFLTKLVSFGSDESDEPAKPFEVWAMDVPKYQLDGVVAKLQKDNFFRRSKILGSSTYLGVSLDGKGFGKNYRNVDELDALIVRVRRQGWQVGPDGKPLHRRRPAQPPKQQRVYQARADAPWNGNGAPGPNQQVPEYRPQTPQRPANYQPQYEQSGYERSGYDRPQTYQPPRNEQPRYEQPRYDQPMNTQPPFERPSYEQSRYDAPPSQPPAGYQQQQPGSAYPYGG